MREKRMKMDRNEKTYHIFESYKKQWFNLTPTIEETVGACLILYCKYFKNIF
jgi:hypothetical protein